MDKFTIHCKFNPVTTINKFIHYQPQTRREEDLIYNLLGIIESFKGVMHAEDVWRWTPDEGVSSRFILCILCWRSFCYKREKLKYFGGRGVWKSLEEPNTVKSGCVLLVFTP